MGFHEPGLQSDEANESRLGVRVLVQAESGLGYSAAKGVIQALRDKQRLSELVQELVFRDGLLREETSMSPSRGQRP